MNSGPELPGKKRVGLPGQGGGGTFIQVGFIDPIEINFRPCFNNNNIKSTLFDETPLVRKQSHCATLYVPNWHHEVVEIIQVNI